MLNAINQNILKLDFPNLYAALLEGSKDFKGVQLPISTYGIECGDGWFSIIYILSGKLEELIKVQPPKKIKLYHAIQIKEELGLLKFQLANYTKEMKDLIHFYEKRSTGVCDICGGDGDLLNTAGILHSRCPKH